MQSYFLWINFVVFFLVKILQTWGRIFVVQFHILGFSMNVVRFAYSEDGFRIKCYSVIVKLGYS